MKPPIQKELSRLDFFDLWEGQVGTNARDLRDRASMIPMSYSSTTMVSSTVFDNL